MSSSFTYPIVDANCLFGSWPRSELDASIEAVTAARAAAGIECAVLGSLRAATHDPTVGNAEALAACSQSAGLYAAGAVNLRRSLDPAGEVAKLRREGFALLRVWREYEGWPLDYAPFEDVLQAAAAHALPVMVAALQLGDLTVLARLVERAGCRVIVTGVNTSHTPLVAEAVAVGRRCPHLFLETSRLEGVDTVDLMAAELGAERLVFGTGLPFQYAASALALVEHSSLSPRERERVLCRNVLELLGVEAG